MWEIKNMANGQRTAMVVHFGNFMENMLFFPKFSVAGIDRYIERISGIIQVTDHEIVRILAVKISTDQGDQL